PLSWLFLCLSHRMPHANATQLGERLEGRIEACHVSGVMASVMQRHRARIDVRLERRMVVRQIGQLVLHGSLGLDLPALIVFRRGSSLCALAYIPRERRGPNLAACRPRAARGLG